MDKYSVWNMDMVCSLPYVDSICGQQKTTFDFISLKLFCPVKRVMAQIRFNFMFATNKHAWSIHSRVGSQAYPQEQLY